MLRVHPLPGSETAETRPSGSTQTPALFLEVSATRAEGLGGDLAGGWAATGPFPQASKNNIWGWANRHYSFPKEKHFFVVVIARNTLEVSKRYWLSKL